MSNVYDVLKERGFIQQATHEEEIRKLLGEEKVTFYIGFDPTADSLTLGGFLQIMLMKHMQSFGHRPIVLLGGGTGMVGDPTDKTEMRRMMFMQEIEKNCESFRVQFAKYLDFGEGKAVFANNADWLARLNYIEFIRDVGVHFSVNRMLTADCYRTRLEKGLSFLEFNYMLMQSYDFLELNKRYNCKLQLGGNDQWSNIIGGVELVRRAESRDVYGMTICLLTTSEGIKMGKTMSGAVWIDPVKTPPYDFFQYLRNIDDNDVKTCLRLLTFIPMDEVERLGNLKDVEINKAKEILAYEVTKIVHGQEEAEKALAAAKALFGGASDGGSIPTAEISEEKLSPGFGIIDALELGGLIATRSEGRRLITQGGVTLNGNKITTIDYMITKQDFEDGKLMLQKGKKGFCRIILK